VGNRRRKSGTAGKNSIVATLEGLLIKVILMGGHSAWRKRQKNGETAKGMGGAIMRHRPHLFRGCRILKKGELRGGNPKKRRHHGKGKEECAAVGGEEEYARVEEGGVVRGLVGAVIVGLMVTLYLCYMVI
jgi:hypothetical protein